MTRYIVTVESDDVGEYDGPFMAHLVEAAARVVGNTGLVGFAVSVERHRDDEMEGLA